MIENLTKKQMKPLRPATAEEAFQAKKKVALKKIERDFADETIRSNFDKFKGDAVQLAAEFTPEELALYILSLTVQDPDSLPEVEIAREKPLPFKYVGGGHGNKNGKGGRGRDNRNRGDRRGGYRGDRNRDERDGDRRRQKRGKRDGHDGSGNRDFKRKSKRNSKDFFNKEKKSSAKNTGFVIRHKGE